MIRQWRWRCAECGHGRHLWAYAQANAYGPLDADGTLVRHDDVVECFTWEDSIQCERHPSAIIEHRVGTRFFRWRHCEHCNGAGRINAGSRYEHKCETCRGERGSWSIPATNHIELNASA